MTAALLQERTGVVTFKGNPVTLVGPEIKVGSSSPAFSLTSAVDMAPTTLQTVLADGTRAALLIVVPSIDTSVCALETVRFNREVSAIPSDKLGVFTISVDLPFAQKRWCHAEHVESVKLLSDYKEHAFGPAFGVWIKELALLARSVFILDKDGIVRYAEIVPEVAKEPDYEAALGTAKALIA